MKVEIDKRVVGFLKKLKEKDSVKAFSYIELFETYGFSLGSRYLKKVGGPIWELRPGKIRLYLFIKAKNQIVVYAIIKKSQKIKAKDLKIIEARIKEYS